MKFLRAIGLTVVPLILAACTGSIFPGVPAFEQLGQASGLTASEEEKIMAVLNDVHQGMQSRQIYKVLGNVSRNYYDSEGRDYNALQANLAELFKKYRDIRITRVPPRLEVRGDYARAVETFGTDAEPFDPAIEPPINLQGQVSVSLEKIGGRWLIVEWGSML